MHPVLFWHESFSSYNLVSFKPIHCVFSTRIVLNTSLPVYTFSCVLVQAVVAEKPRMQERIGGLPLEFHELIALFFEHFQEADYLRYL